MVGGGERDGWVLAGAELEGLVLAEVPRLRQAGLGEHVRLIYVMSGPVADPGLDSTCPPSIQPPQLLPTPTPTPTPIPFHCSSWPQWPPNAGGRAGIAGGGVKGQEVKSAAPGQ